METNQYSLGRPTSAIPLKQNGYNYIRKLQINRQIDLVKNNQAKAAKVFDPATIQRLKRVEMYRDMFLTNKKITYIRGYLT